MTKLIVFDTETTCLDYEKLEIWQLSGMKINLNTKEVEKFNYKFKTNNPLSFEARKRCNIIQETIDTYDVFDKSILIDSLELNEKDVIYLGHNVSFDRNAIKGVLSRDDKLWESKYLNLLNDDLWIDTLRLTKHAYNSVIVEDISGSNPISYALDYLFHYLHLYKVDDNLNFHDAIFDVEITWRLFKHLCQELKLNINNIQEIVNLSNKPIKLTYINFGKYKGEKFIDIFKKDKSYLRWLSSTDMVNPESDDFDEDLLYTLEQL